MRIPPLLVTALLLLAMAPLSAVLPQMPLPEWFRGLFTTLAATVGVMFVLPAGLAFRAVGTTVDPRDPQKTEVLVTNGLYRISRNPMYVGFCCWLLAGALWFASPWLLLATPLFVLYINALQIPAEEAAMADKFGEQWQAYRARVPRWLL